MAITNEFKEVKEYIKGTWINMVNPNEKEIQTVCENVKINDQFIRDALDFEEKARIDQEEDDQKCQQHPKQQTEVGSQYRWQID